MPQAKRIPLSDRKNATPPRDFRGWLLDQARALRKLEGQVAQLDCAELAEELEGMARSDERAAESLLENLLTHLLKWRYQPQRQTRSWRASIQNARSDLRNLLADSPNLKPRLPPLTARAYEKARRTVGAEMDLDHREWEKKSPRACPWQSDFLLRDFWPDAD